MDNIKDDDSRDNTNVTEFPQRRFRFTLTQFGAIHRNTDTPYLVKEIIPSGGLTVVWGSPKCGKSFWAFDISMHIALGLEYRGKRTAHAPVVYVALEGGKAFHNRVEAWRQYHQVPNANFFLVTDRLSLIEDHPYLIEDIRFQTMGMSPPGLVVIDTLNRSLDGSENSDKDMADYIKAADAIRLYFGCAVMLIHHCGHNDERPRGHSSLRGALDCEIAVTRHPDSNSIVTNVHWMKDGVEGNQTFSKLEVVELGLDEEGDPLTSCVVIEVDEEQNPVQRGHSRTVTLFMRIFNTLLVEHGVPFKPFRDGPEVLAVNLALVREEFYKQHPQPETEAKRKAWNRAVERAQSDNIIAIRESSGLQQVWSVTA